MEFLLINHPIDCPICDQGGECDLQNLFFKKNKKLCRVSRYPTYKGVGSIKRQYHTTHRCATKVDALDVVKDWDGVVLACVVGAVTLGLGVYVLRKIHKHYTGVTGTENTEAPQQEVTVILPVLNEVEVEVEVEALKHKDVTYTENPDVETLPQMIVSTFNQKDYLLSRERELKLALDTQHLVCNLLVTVSEVAGSGILSHFPTVSERLFRSAHLVMTGVVREPEELMQHVDMVKLLWEVGEIVNTHNCFYSEVILASENRLVVDEERLELIARAYKKLDLYCSYNSLVKYKGRGTIQDFYVYVINPENSEPAKLQLEPYMYLMKTTHREFYERLMGVYAECGEPLDIFLES